MLTLPGYLLPYPPLNILAPKFAVALVADGYVRYIGTYSPGVSLRFQGLAGALELLVRPPALRHQDTGIFFAGELPRILHLLHQPSNPSH